MVLSRIVHKNGVLYLHKEALDNDRTLLTHTPSTPNGLFLQGRIEHWLQQEDMIGCCQVDAHSSRACCQQEDSRWRILAEIRNGCTTPEELLKKP